MKSKLIVLNNHNRINNVVIRDNYEFKVVPVVCNNYDNKAKEIISKKKKVVIEIMDLELNIAKVHPVTDFVTLWKEKSYNTQKNRAYTVVRFFNFLLENNNRFKLNTFCDIEIFHGNEYLSYVALNRCSESYFLAERKTLDKLYLYLSDKKLLNNIDSSIFENMKVTEYKYTNRAVVNHIVGTIFKDCIYPSNKKNSKRLHVLKEEFIIPFIETSIEIEPRIALGIFMQCFGGLRRSEVVNTKKNSISMFDWGTVKLEVNVNDEIISDVIKDYNQASNKRQRKQVIYNVGDYLPKLLKMHLIDKKYYALDGSNALFSNKKNQLLTASMYSYYFNKVKRVFIKKLLASKNKEIQMYGMFLNAEKWSTHIGRGIASNFIADATNNPYQVATFRGDTNLNSSLVYTENTSLFKEMINKSASKMYEDGIKKLQEIK